MRHPPFMEQTGVAARQDNDSVFRAHRGNDGTRGGARGGPPRSDSGSGSQHHGYSTCWHHPIFIPGGAASRHEWLWVSFRSKTGQMVSKRGMRRWRTQEEEHTVIGFAAGCSAI